jgi:riboflavin transporter FmnP
MRNERLYRLVMTAVLGSLAFLMMAFGQIHVPPFAQFLRYDPGDVPAIIAAYTLGPVAGVTVQTIKSLLFLFSGKSSAGWVGVLANYLAGVGLVIATGLVHRLLGSLNLRSWAWGLVSAAAGTLVMAALLIPLNALLVYPLYGMTGEAAWYGALSISTPFNLFKGFVSSLISLAFYRRLEPVLLGRTVHRAA